MRKVMVLGVLCFSATVAFAQTQKKPGENAEKNAKVKMIPINVKTGLWQSTSTVTITGALGMPPEILAKLTPEQRARYEAAMQSQAAGHTRTSTHTGCITEKDLASDPFEQKDSDGRLQCHETVLRSTSSEVEVEESCTGEASMNFRMKIHAVDREHAVGTGQGTATMGGHTMKSNIKFESKWLGATCPAKK